MLGEGCPLPVSRARPPLPARAPPTRRPGLPCRPGVARRCPRGSPASGRGSPASGRGSPASGPRYVVSVAIATETTYRLPRRPALVPDLLNLPAYVSWSAGARARQPCLTPAAPQVMHRICGPITKRCNVCAICNMTERSFRLVNEDRPCLAVRHGPVARCCGTRPEGGKIHASNERPLAAVSALAH
jgi:hypothetical protein